MRAAALHLASDLAPRLLVGDIPGAIAGLWRGENALNLAQMQALLDRQRLPAEFVQAHAGALPNGANAWLYPQGGWVSPPALVAAWLNAPGIDVRLNTAVDALRAMPGGGWQLLGRDGSELTRVDAVVLANAHGLSRLVPDGLASTWRLQATRAQSSLLPPPLQTGLPRLTLPIADRGYVLRLADGSLLCGGASSDPVAVDHVGWPDTDTLTTTDHARNLHTLTRLTGWQAPVEPATLHGHTGWRLASADRMPVIGPVPMGNLAATAGRLEQSRWVPRQPGLYVRSALGSRGLIQAALGGQVLASWLTGAPIPTPLSLLDTIDPGRFVARAARHAWLSPVARSR